MRLTEEITLEGHIIDSYILPRVWDRIMDSGGEFDLLEIRVGKTKQETSFARMKISADSPAQMDALMEALTELGAVVTSPDDAQTEPAPRDGALPDDFYSTTNLPTQVRLGGDWVEVANTEMDLAIVVPPSKSSAAMIPMTDVKQGDAVVVGHDGIRVQPLVRSRDKEIFSFMNADVSSERPKRLVISQIAREMQETRARGGRILFVAGPAIVHSGAAPALAALIRHGYVNVLFGGNAIAAHDCESALFGTSLGVALTTGQPVEGGHRHHMRAINRIRRAGSLRAAVEQGILKSGIMYEAVRGNIELVLAGSVRDDGPIPDVITDMLEAQKRMRAAVSGVELALMVSTMLHSIATGNMLPAWVKTVAVDINPAVVTKLADRGTFQALGLVTDAELFLRELGEELGDRLMPMLPKLRATLREQQLVARGDTLVIGVSGGPDSLALLHALKTLAPELELKLHVAHLNHQLRGDASDADEQFVAQTAVAWSLPMASARWDVGAYASETGMSIEEAARNLRYQFLMGVAKQVHANAIAVAHNADDQVETILLHFLRGAGLTGLRGMEYKTQLWTHAQHAAPSDPDPSSVVSSAPLFSNGSSFALIRPLLDIPRAEIEAYCAEHALQPRQDETNRDTAILRNRVRHEVIPYLEALNPNLRNVLRHSALSLADDYAYIHQNVLGIFDRMTRPFDGGYVFERKWFRALPINLQRGVLREAVARLRRLKNIGYQHIENARRVAADKEAGAEATLPQGLVLVVGYDDFTVGAHLPLPDAPLLLHDAPITLNIGDEKWLPESDWLVRVSQTSAPPSETQTQWSAFFNADAIRGALVLRPRRSGERFAPRGMGGKRKSMHEYMIDEKIPRHVRELTPVVADDEKILWVVGYRTDERSTPQPAGDSLLIEFFKG